MLFPLVTASYATRTFNTFKSFKQFKSFERRSRSDRLNGAQRLNGLNVLNSSSDVAYAAGLNFGRVMPSPLSSNTTSTGMSM